MKKIIMISAFLSVLLASLCMTGCSSSTSSGGSSNDPVITGGIYRGELSNGSETGSFKFRFSSKHCYYNYSAPGSAGISSFKYIISGSKIEEDKEDDNKKIFIAELTEDKNKLNVIRFKAWKDEKTVWAGTVTRVAE